MLAEELWDEEINETVRLLAISASEVQARGITDPREVQEVVKAAQTVLGRHVVIE